MHTTQYVCICVCVCIKCSNHQTINSKWTPSLVARFVAHFHVERVKKPAPHHTHSHTHSRALSLARSCTQLLSRSLCLPLLTLCAAAMQRNGNGTQGNTLHGHFDSPRCAWLAWLPSAPVVGVACVSTQVCLTQTPWWGELRTLRSLLAAGLDYVLTFSTIVYGDCWWWEEAVAATVGEGGEVGGPGIFCLLFLGRVCCIFNRLPNTLG